MPRVAFKEKLENSIKDSSIDTFYCF